MCCGLGGYCGPITSGPMKGYQMTPVRVAVPPYLSEHASIAYAARPDYESGNGLSALEFAAEREPSYSQHHGTYVPAPKALVYAGPVQMPEVTYDKKSVHETELSLPERLALEEGYRIGQALQAFGDYSMYSQWRNQMGIMDTLDAGNFNVMRGSRPLNPAIPVYIQEEIPYQEQIAIEERRTRLENDIARLRPEKEVMYVN